MSRKLELSNRKYGKLIVIKRSKKRPTHWVCLCDCGNSTEVHGGHLRHGHTTSCGCYKREVGRTHGMSGTPEYITWENIVQRTTNPNHPQFKYWGGRGITMCDRWLNSFENFYDDMGDKPNNLTIDRIDNNKGYYPENCRWATMKEQNLNTRRTTKITYNNITMSKSEWANYLGIKYITVCSRFSRGWSIEKALSKKNYTGSNQFKEII